jgi:hypothetical protein
VDASADDVEVVSDSSPLWPDLARRIGRALQLSAERRAGGELPGSFGQAAQDELAGVTDDR